MTSYPSLIVLSKLISYAKYAVGFVRYSTLRLFFIELMSIDPFSLSGVFFNCNLAWS